MQTAYSMPGSMRGTGVEAVNMSAASKYVRKSSHQTGGSNLDIAFLHSDALVKCLQPLQWEMTLSPEEMFEDMTMELESNP
jgi:hypothetical protein